MKTSELQKFVYRNLKKNSKIVPEWNGHLEIFSHIQTTDNLRSKRLQSSYSAKVTFPFFCSTGLSRANIER